MMFYVFIFLALLGTGVGLFPLPEDLIVVSAGIGIQQELGSAWIVFFIILAGILISDYIIFWVGKEYGLKILKIKFFSFFFPEEKVERVQKIFGGHKNKLIFLGRFISGLRPVIFFTAGISKIKSRNFLFTDLLASFIYIPFLMFLGYRFSYDISRITEDITRVYHLIEIVIIGGMLVWFMLRAGKLFFQRQN